MVMGVNGSKSGGQGVGVRQRAEWGLTVGEVARLLRERG